MAGTSARVAKLELALAGLQELELAGLRRRWQALTGWVAPATFRTQLLRAAVAYKLQQRVHGGLKASTRRLLHHVAKLADPTGLDPAAGSAATANLGSDGAGEGRGPAGEVLGRRFELKNDGAVSLPQSGVRRRVPQPPLRIKPGTRLLRTWQGSTHEVLVGDSTVSYRGQQYRSLSEVARLITGQRWSGPLFFGLKRRSSPGTE